MLALGAGLVVIAFPISEANSTRLESSTTPVVEKNFHQFDKSEKRESTMKDMKWDKEGMDYISKKLNIYLLKGKITQEQYDEAMMNLGSEGIKMERNKEHKADKSDKVEKMEKNNKMHP
jgi:hypothetical protein